MDSLPPFPDGMQIAHIARISSAKLLSHDIDESVKVLEACKQHGFFYLDMRDSTLGQELLNNADSLLGSAIKFFDSDINEKRRYLMIKNKSVAGYKEAVPITNPSSGPSSGSRTEFLNIFKDHIHDISKSRDYPSILLAQKAVVRAFNYNAHTCGLAVLKALEQGLSLSPSQLTELHNFDLPAEDHLRMTRTLPSELKEISTNLPPHTDFGSVTVLFNWLGGLQIESTDPENKGQWVYVKPIPGHAIINLGDAMVVFTNGHVKSAKHRVVPAPGRQAEVNRHSLVYFLRPNDEVYLRPLSHFESRGSNQLVDETSENNGKVYKAAEWSLKRATDYGAFKEASQALDHSKKEQNKI